MDFIIFISLLCQFRDNSSNVIIPSERFRQSTWIDSIELILSIFM